MAARSVHRPALVSQTPSLRLSSGSSAVESTMKSAAGAGAGARAAAANNPTSRSRMRGLSITVIGMSMPSPETAPLAHDVCLGR